MKAQLERVVDELLTNDVLAPGRHHEKLAGWQDVYSVRLSKGYRFAYQLLSSGGARAVAVGTHDEVYRSVDRKR